MYIATYRHTCILTYVSTYMHTHRHTYTIYTCMYTFICTDVCMYYARMCMFVYVHIECLHAVHT